MQLQIKRPELVGLFAWLLSDPKWTFIVETVRDNVSFLGKSIVFNKKVLVGNMRVRMDIYPTPEGHVELDIQEVSISGIPIMALARKKAGEMILKTLAPYSHIVKTWKHSNGNLRAEIPGAKITALAIANDTLTLQAEITAR